MPRARALLDERAFVAGQIENQFAGTDRVFSLADLPVDLTRFGNRNCRQVDPPADGAHQGVVRQVFINVDLG